MKVFERDQKINFVDEKNVFLGYSLEQNCCENAGWFISDKPEENIHHETGHDLEGFVFDTKYFKELDGENFDCGGMKIFKIIKGKEELFIHIFNVQNGYYSHGFELNVGGQQIRYGFL